MDRTGLKLGGPGEWLLEKHGARKRRSWRVLHIGTDAASGRMVAATLTDRGVDDGAQVGPLLDQVADSVVVLTGDGAYDRNGVYADVHQRHPQAAVIVPARRDAVPSGTAETAPTQRDRHLQAIDERGQMAWQRLQSSGSRGEPDRTLEARHRRQPARPHRRAQAAEVTIAVELLNRMLDLGRPNSVRVA